MKSRFTLWVIIILTLLAVLIDLPKLPIKFAIFDVNIAKVAGAFPLKLGLDLQGGTQLVLQTQMDKIASGDRDSALESAKEVIERRVNLFGVSEALVQSSKIGEERRILVELPGIKDASEAASLVGKTAQLEFRELIASEAASTATPSAFLTLEDTKPTGLTGADLRKAQVSFGSTSSSGPVVNLQFTPEGSKKFTEITKRNVNNQLPIFLDNIAISAPVVRQEIVGDAIIEGMSLDEAKRLAIQLNAGALPVPIKIIEQRSIGASLGQQSVNKSLQAGLIGLLTVVLYMAIYYGWLGLLADLALVIYSLLVLAIFKTGLFLIPPVTLTLAGIAGFILSIGMAVDANILIFERMKEEKRWGRSAAQALELGFKRAWSSIRDSNISSLITATILYFMGTGLVRGFALTLAIGVLVSMFTAVVVTRTLLRMFIK
ncbi:protein translocase subunit SecD [Candidatus Daviesbacteria bacterium]|nr:protein translocase subunit SecD [Candidatus Daviesbacteria bacterium]